MNKTIKKICAITIMFITLNQVSAQWTDQTSGISNDLNDVYFINNSTGWAVGRQGKILYTNNAGATWTLQNSGTTNDLNKVFMVNASTGYVVGDGGKTLKYNGSTWSTLSIGFSQEMQGVYFLDANTGWISGDWGRIMMTTDGGSSWTTQVDNSMYSNLFYDLHMISASEGWAVGTSGRVLKYNGSFWNNVSTPATGDLYSVSFNSSSDGIMTGENSKVYYYNGSSFVEHSTSLPDNSFHVYSVTSVSPSLAYAATTPGFGGGGIILKYNGSTWTNDYTYTGMWSELFYGIHFPTSTKGYAVGAGAMIKSFGSGSGIFDEENESSTISIFPNPCGGNNLTIDFAEINADNTSLFVTDILGKQVYNTNKLVGGSNLIQFPHSLIQGTYIVKINTANKQFTKKFVVE